MSRRYRTYICAPDLAERDLDEWEKECPNVAQHEPHPLGYVAFFEWADEKAKTHDQARCRGCGRLAIWVPRP